MMRLRLKEEFSRNEERNDGREVGNAKRSRAPAINAFVHGSSARLCSSNKLGWDGVYLEHHRMFPGERNDSVSTHHFVVLCTSHVARGETSWEHARFFPYSFSPGDMKLHSAGLIGACRRSTPPLLGPRTTRSHGRSQQAYEYATRTILCLGGGPRV